MVFAGFAYYQNIWHGHAVNDEDEFNRLAERASAYINRMTNGRAVKPISDERVLEALRNAVCDLVDIEKDEDRLMTTAYSDKPQLASESVGKWSRSYSTKTASSTDMDVFDRRKRSCLTTWLAWTGLLSAVAHRADWGHRPWL